MRGLRHESKRLVAAVALLVAAATYSSGGAQLQAGKDKLPEPAVYDALESSPDAMAYVIIRLEPAATATVATMQERRQAVKKVQEGVLQELGPGEFEIVYKYENFSAMTGRVNSAGLAKLVANPNVTAVGLDAAGHGHLDDSVPFINADTVHSLQSFLGYTGEGITVAVLDSGIDSDHPDVNDDVARGWYHFLAKGGQQGLGAEDDNGHGTNVAGIITSKGDVAPVGVAPDADILAIKVLGTDCNGWASDWAAGVDHVVSHKDDYDNLCIINMSLGTGAMFSECPCDSVGDEPGYSWLGTLRDSLDAAQDAGIVIFASSGNDGNCTEMPAPACLSAATAVAAVYDQDLDREPDSGTYYSRYGGSWPNCYDATTYGDLIACFSNRNACNELAAPGRDINAPGMGGGTSTYTGTSQASPHCAGVAALMCEKAEGLGLTFTPAGIVQVMKATGASTVDNCDTSPNPIRVDALAALNDFESRTVLKHKQMPNTTGHSIDIACDRYDDPGPTVSRVVADDFSCTKTGPITKVILWSSFEDDKKYTIGRIHLSIYDDAPDPDGGGSLYSEPNNLLWERDFYEEDFTESLYYTIPPFTIPAVAWWWDPAGGEAATKDPNHKETWRYDIFIDPCDAFVQRADPCNPLTYWLGVYVQFGLVPQGLDPGFGWKTALLSEGWNDSGVWSDDGGTTWNELKYPPGHDDFGSGIDLSFKIIGKVCNCADYECDEIVEFKDYAWFADDWKWSGWGGGYNHSDLNCDGSVDFNDVEILTGQWLNSCP
ncbi:MAG: S8 family serine peptidase [Planctomycetota bacterium]|jgi:subtilisin family serine protease